MNTFQILSTIVAFIISAWLMSKCFENAAALVFGGFFSVSLFVLTIYYNGVLSLVTGML